MLRSAGSKLSVLHLWRKADGSGIGFSDLLVGVFECSMAVG
ncbi:hypothetical protein A2U01_0111866 [Trifolium medium]|uniref:Uncharacterized protein n=1 Tax=Trifolium medium TaxID=97028 RepID=A0A392VSV5_9FABA|nr:hypothetical protein [Trifolium medium]